MLEPLHWAGLRLLHLIAPRCCAACAAPLPFPEELFCQECCSSALATLSTTQPGFPVTAIGRYQPPLSRAIRNFKYSGRFDLAKPLARAMRDSASALCREPTVFVPVPLHPKRLAERGYNQAALLAHCLAKLCSGSVNVSAVRRVAHTAQQARLAREDREHNLTNTMHAETWCDARPVLLVDDVFTTGATLLECTRALQDAGARVMGACVIAIAGTPADDTEPGAIATAPELTIV